MGKLILNIDDINCAQKVANHLLQMKLQLSHAILFME